MKLSCRNLSKVGRHYCFRLVVLAAFVKEKTTGERWSPKTKVIAEGVFRLLTEEFGEDADLGTIIAGESSRTRS